MKDIGKMNRKVWLSLLPLAGSFAQLLFPHRMFAHAVHYARGYLFVPGDLLL